MTIQIDANGITKTSYSDKLTTLQNNLQTFNPNITFNDNDVMRVITEDIASLSDVLEEVVMSYLAEFSVESASDNRLNLLIGTYFSDVEIRGASNTIQPIDVTFSQSVTLTGLDDSESGVGVFTIQDSSGNNYYLANTTSFVLDAELAQDTLRVNFIAQDSGDISSSIGDITNITTPIIGVVSVINATTYTSKGNLEDSPMVKRLKLHNAKQQKQKDVIRIQNALLNLDNVNYAKCYDLQNVETAEAGYIYVVIDAGNSDDIADVINRNKAGGISTSGSVVNVNTNGDVIRWDWLDIVDIKARLVITQNASKVINTEDLKAYIVANIDFPINTVAYSAQISQIAQEYLNSKENAGGVDEHYIALESALATDANSIPVQNKKTKFSLIANNIVIEII